MATTYYVSNNTTSRGWTVAQTGTSTGDPLLGSGGLQRALNLVVAGDTIIVKGDVFASAPAFEQKYLGQVTTTNDKSATWLVGDAVQDNSTGLIWSGKILSIAAKVIKISLDVGAYANIATANGINNTTRTDTDTLSAKAAGTFNATTSGTNAAIITITGGDANYTAGGGFFKLIGNSGYTLNMAVQYYSVKYCVIDGDAAASNCIYFSNTFNSFYRCYLSNSTGALIYAYQSYFRLVECIFMAQSGGTTAQVDAMTGAYGGAIILNCKFIGSKGVGFSTATAGGNFIVGNIFHGMARQAISCTSGANSCIMGNIIDTTGATYSGIYKTVVGSDRICFNRITNCGGYGIEYAADQFSLEDYNYFQNNSSGNLLNIAAGAKSVSGSDTNCGFADPAYATSHDFRLATNASGRRTEINFDFDLATALNKFHFTMGLPPTDRVLTHPGMNALMNG